MREAAELGAVPRRLRRAAAPLMAKKKEEESGGFALPTLPELDLPFELPSLGAGKPRADTT